MNETVKLLLDSFIISRWKILPCKDLSNHIAKYNAITSDIKIEDAEVTLWFTQGEEDTFFFLQEYWAESKIEDTEDVFKEYMGVLVVYQDQSFIFSTSWHGTEKIILGDICATNCKVAQRLTKKMKDHT
jgi:hypothetical protein